MSRFITRYLTDAQQAKVMATLRSHAAVLARRDYAWISLLRSTGLRIGEFARMNLADAEFALKTGWLYIPRENRKATGGKPATGDRPARAATRQDHQVPVTRPVREALEALCAIHAEMGGPGTPEAPLVFSRKHGRMSVRTYEFRMAHWCQAAGIGHASPHWLRHTRAMNIMRRSTSANPLRLVQAALGHGSIASTGIYTAVSKEELLEGLEAVDGASRLPSDKVAAAYAQKAAA
jgi:site-specific recombinase XerC